ncbi:MAG: DNA repair protein RecO [Gracilibacteraceae bacterium]|jgi:DNA repair protein RecO (recombination protein O)|nr:DNA repair protein RecO [Gracilibacteraceae bacterium]
MAVFQADALVLRSREYGEADRILTLFSREYGKIEAVAKGVRRPASKQRGGTQLFTYADFLLHRGRTLATVQQAQPRESFPHLWGDWEKSRAAAIMAELLDAVTVREEPAAELFRLTLAGFFLIAAVEPDLLITAYALKTLEAQGHWSAAASDSPDAPLGPGSRAMLRRLLLTPPEQLDRLRWSREMRDEIVPFVRRWAETRLERRLAAWNLTIEIPCRP